MDDVELLTGAWDPRVIAARCGETVTCFAVACRDLVVVVDTMVSPQSARDFQKLLPAGQSTLVLNTHADWDHYWGNQVFPAPILGSRRCAERVREEGERELARLRAEYPGRFDEVRLVGPQVLDCSRIEGGDLTLEIVPTPGHQPDHVAVWIPEIKLLLAGDAAEEPFPLVDDPAGLPELRRSLERMRALEPDWVLACHAPPERGAGLLERNLAYFDSLERACREASGPPPADDSALAAWAALPERPQWGEFYTRAHRTAIRVMASAYGR